MATPRVLSTAAHCLLVMLLCTLFPRITQAQDVTLTPSGKVLSGADEYRRYCAQCHGMSGRGDGPVAGELKVPPPDLTLLSRNNRGQFPFQMVYESISGQNQLKAHGTREMPSFYLQFARPRNQFGMGTLHRSDYQIDQEIKRITNYIKSMQQQ
jgi:mono/diheme cytochrome c family protein